MTPSPGLRRVVTQLLNQETGKSRTSAELTAVTVRVYEQFVYRLAPLIGEGGLQAIFTRSVKLTQTEFPFLTWDSAVGLDGIVQTQIWTALKEQEAGTIKLASEALLLTFAGLVANLIGEQLAWRFLFNVPPETLSRGPRQETME